MSARYVTWVDGDEATVELVEVGPRHVVARVEREGEEPRELRLDRAALGSAGPAGADTHLILEGGASLSASARPGHHGAVAVNLLVGAGGREVDVRVVSERDAWLGEAGDGHHGEDEVTVSMPGRVVKLMAQEGDVVEAGQALLIIEAMKMENEVHAGRAGVVAKIHVTAGDSVESDAVLMEIQDA